jgi:hypothetical protein
MGRVTASELGVRVGESIEFVGPTQSETFRVTGLVVVPGLGSNDGLGTGAIVTMSGLVRLDVGALPTSAAVLLSVDVERFVDGHPELGGGSADPRYTPGAIANVARVRSVPYALAVVLAVLAVLTVVQALRSATRGSLRDLAVLSALGAGVHFRSRAVHWMASSFAAACVVVAIPVGLIAGRTLFTTYARNMGAVDDSSVPVAMIAIGVIVAVMIANVLVAVTARRVRNLRPAVLLRAE